MKNNTCTSNTPVPTPSLLQNPFYTRLWSALQIYTHDISAEVRYQDMLIAMYLLALKFAIEIIACITGAGSNTIFTFVQDNFNW